MLVAQNGGGGLIFFYSAGFSLTAELGDFNPEEHKDGYLSGFLFIPEQSEDFEKLVTENHKQHR